MVNYIWYNQKQLSTMHWCILSLFELLPIFNLFPFILIISCV